MRSLSVIASFSCRLPSQRQSFNFDDGAGTNLLPVGVGPVPAAIPASTHKRVHSPSPSAVRGLTRPGRAASGNRGGRNRSCCGPGSSLRKPPNALMYQPVKIFWHSHHSRLSNTWQVFFVPRFQQAFLPGFASEKFRKRAENFGPLCTNSLNSERQKVEFELFRQKSLCILTKIKFVICGVFVVATAGRGTKDGSVSLLSLSENRRGCVRLRFHTRACFPVTGKGPLCLGTVQK